MKTSPPQIDLFNSEPAQTSMNCAVLRSITSPDILKIISISDVLNDIKTERYKPEIDALPNATTDKKAYTAAKKTLPAWALNGEFSGKVVNSAFTESNGLFHIDIDGIEDPHALKNQLVHEIPEIYALWISPSGNGLKGLIRIPDDFIHDDADFKKAFTQIDRYLSVYEVTIDRACKDVRRLAFVGSDADIFINTHAPAFIFDTVQWDFKPDIRPPLAVKTSISNHADRYINRCCDLILNATAGNYHNARLRAGKLAGGFISAGLVDEIEAMRALSDASDTISSQCGDNQQVIQREQKTIYDAIQHGKGLPVEQDRQTGQTGAVLDRLSTKPSAVLDSEHHHCTVDFLKFVDDDHLLKKLALAIAAATHLPAHTVFLMGLGVFASVACKRWRVEYQHGGSMPIGIYVVAEQPSGAAKSWCLKTVQSPFYEAEKEAKNTARARLYTLKSGDKNPDDLKEIETLESVIKSVLFTTNSTPEALEQSLTHSRGYFSAVSSEQGLFNTMLGACYSSDKVSNNDLLLNGFDGGYMSSKRVGRDSYTGTTVGGAVMFAQQGGIETLLKASNGTGLAERFLLIAEKHNLGSRDHTKPAIISHELIEKYAAVCASFAVDVLINPVDYDQLQSLKISTAGWRLIAEYRNSIEHHLADGGRYSHVSIRGAAAKIDIQNMKIAAVLSLLDNPHCSVIDDNHVTAAIGIAHAMIEANLKLCQDKGIIGVKAEYTSILSLFENNQGGRTQGNIVQAKRLTNPFKEFTGNRNKLIRETLDDMVKDGYLQLRHYPAERVEKYTLAK